MTAAVLRLIAILCCLIAAGCAGTPGPAASGAQAPAVVVQHGQGAATVPAKPRRVVAVGSADVQIAAALGANLVAVVRNPSSPDGNWPGTAKLAPEVLALDLVTPNLERIAAARPDLILATSAQPEYHAQYQKLSAIAPVVSYRRSLLLDSGDDLTRMIGAALGEDARAAAMVDDSRRRMERFVSEHPRVRGMSYAFGQYGSGNLHLVMADDTTSARFLTALGMRVPDPLKRLGTTDNTRFGMTPLGPELLATLDSADVAFISTYGEGARQELTANPLVAGLRMRADGRLHLISVDLAGELLMPNPAITAHLLDELAPLVAKAGG
ncbi:ABC transporter substrate-binding protein [Pseudonocardia acaciae]|uniref:ABC transporter substrate-binding protein n=1 Tax=Pseudonocardia acaciae TaxID=551276 RepID=UPI000491F1E7|nr:ABC transporter substrate-binding protein [Pseudonocardia acaciae]